MQLFLSLHLRPGALDAMAQVRMNQSLRERFQSLACGYQLHQYFRALTVLLQHPLYRLQLPNNAANPKFLSVALISWKRVLFHGRSIPGCKQILNPGLEWEPEAFPIVSEKARASAIRWSRIPGLIFFAVLSFVSRRALKVGRIGSSTEINVS
jgi:hypothetical protein